MGYIKRNIKFNDFFHGKVINPLSAKPIFGRKVFFFYSYFSFYAGEISMETFYLENSLKFFIEPLKKKKKKKSS